LKEKGRYRKQCNEGGSNISTIPVLENWVAMRYRKHKNYLCSKVRKICAILMKQIYRPNEKYFGERIMCKCRLDNDSASFKFALPVLSRLHYKIHAAMHAKLQSAC
jgi:hypothetical protein